MACQLRPLRSRAPAIVPLLAALNVKLHDAIDEVLADYPDGLSSREIADEIERRQLYLRPSDGQAATASQVSARVGRKTYSDRYERLSDGKIRLRAKPEGEEAPEGLVGKLLHAMAEKYGPIPESFTFGDGIDWSSKLEPIPLYVELPFWMMVPAGDLDVEWSGVTFRVNIMRSWMEVFAVEVLDSKLTVLHHGPLGKWTPPADVAENLAAKEVPLISRPCKTIIRLNTRAHLSAFRDIDPEKEPPRAAAEQHAYWASLCEAHIPVLNELIQRYRLVSYDYFAYEVSAWDVPVWYLGYGDLARRTVLLPYNEWDSKPTLTRDGDKPGAPLVTDEFRFAEVEDLAAATSRDATPGEFDLLDARGLLDRGDYTGAVRRIVTAIEAVTEWALRRELEKKYAESEVESKLSKTENDFPGRLRQWRKLSKSTRVTDFQVELFDRTRTLRHEIVHRGQRLTQADRGEAERCVDTGRWLYNMIEERSDREQLRERGKLSQAVGRVSMRVQFPATVGKDGITLGPLSFSVPGQG